MNIIRMRKREGLCDKNRRFPFPKAVFFSGMFHWNHGSRQTLHSHSLQQCVAFLSSIRQPGFTAHQGEMGFNELVKLIWELPVHILTVKRLRRESRWKRTGEEDEDGVIISATTPSVFVQVHQAEITASLPFSEQRLHSYRNATYLYVSPSVCPSTICL